MPAANCLGFAPDKVAIKLDSRETYRLQSRMVDDQRMVEIFSFKSNAKGSVIMSQATALTIRSTIDRLRLGTTETLLVVGQHPDTVCIND